MATVALGCLTSFSEHASVVEAILAQDGELAAKRIREHVVVQGQRFADLVATLLMLGNRSRG
jgi:DNA-binding GntR family transcriptional regulator